MYLPKKTNLCHVPTYLDLLNFELSLVISTAVYFECKLQPASIILYQA